MTSTPTRVASRLVTTIKRFQPVLSSAKSRDVNESDTVIIVTDMLSDIFGYEKYSEITSEHAIRGTYCDLATMLESKVQLLLEAKAIGIELKDSHVKQAVDYAANKGVDWVVLTNGIQWKIYKVVFGKPIDQELVYEIDFLSLDTKNDEHLAMVYVLSKEGWIKEVLNDLHEQKQILNKFVVAAVAASEPVLDVMRRELRRISPDVKISNEQIQNVLLQEVLKREVVEGDKADDARKKVSRAAKKLARAEKATIGDIQVPVMLAQPIIPSDPPQSQPQA
jgi:predicted type IV restriction endonuclease